jgi:hypothetical protein
VVPKPSPLLNISPDHHELTIRGAAIEADAQLLATARAPLAAARVLKEKLNVLIKEGTNLPQLARDATPYVGNVTKALDAATATLSKRREVVEGKIASVLAPGEDAVAGEVRTFWRSQKEPFAAAVAAVNAGDLRTTKALLGAQPFLTGLTQEQHDQLREQARAKFAGADAALSSEIGAALDRIASVGSAFVAQVGGAVHFWGAADRASDGIKARLA